MSYIKQNAIIFDLDMTLIDTSALIELRAKKKWEEVYAKFEYTRPFPKVAETINHFGLYYKIGVVTSSPRTYAEKLLAFHKLDIPVIAAYHDTNNHKLSPEPLSYAVQKMDLNPKEDIIITIGDEVNDILASKSANEIYGINPERHAPFDIYEAEDFNPYIHRYWLDYHDNGFNPYCVSWGLETVHQLIEVGAMYIVYDFDELRDMFGAGYGMCEFPPDLLVSKEDSIPHISEHWHVINYFPTNTAFHDKWSESILEFKNGNYRFVKKWAQLVCEQVDYEFPKLDFIVRVLNSDETSVGDHYHPLDEVGQKIEQITGAEYYPYCIKKKRPVRQLKYLGRVEREMEIKDNYYIEFERSNSEKCKILIVDDILTTGLTASTIAQELKNVLPHSTIYLLTLGKTSRPDYDGLSDNSHMEIINF